MKTLQTPTWSAGGGSARGAAHIRKNMPNQDAIAWRNGEACALAVADGHGSATHFRSDVGATLAVESAAGLLAAFAAQHARSSTAAILQASADLPAAIHKAWRARVAEHLARVPVPEDQPKTSDLVPYGATLIAAVALRDGLLVLQIGDGDLVVGFTDGSMERPLPDDQGLVGEETYSLCADDAAKRFRLTLVGADGAHGSPCFAMLSTDGLSKSFADDKAFIKNAFQWRKSIAQAGLAGALSTVEDWLSQASHQGSADDITLGLMVVPDADMASKPVPPSKTDQIRTIDARARRSSLLSWTAIAISILSLTWLAAGAVIRFENISLDQLWHKIVASNEDKPAAGPPKPAKKPDSKERDADKEAPRAPPGAKPLQNAVPVDKTPSDGGKT